MSFGETFKLIHFFTVYQVCFILNEFQQFVFSKKLPHFILVVKSMYEVPHAIPLLSFNIHCDPKVTLQYFLQFPSVWRFFSCTFIMDLQFESIVVHTCILVIQFCQIFQNHFMLMQSILACIPWHMRECILYCETVKPDWILLVGSDVAEFF